VPPKRIPELILQARALGAAFVVVHGETLAEPVEPGTNRAAIEGGCDILAHPGLLTPEEAELAAQKGVLLEISARKGHSLANGHVAALARRTGAGLLVNSDAHAPSDLMTPEFQRSVALGAGLAEEEFLAALENALSLGLAAFPRAAARGGALGSGGGGPLSGPGSGAKAGGPPP
jgi:histidinol phosphatase-like PHP family hydrolase